MLLFDKKVTLPSKSKYFCFKENKSTTTIGKESFWTDMLGYFL